MAPSSRVVPISFIDSGVLWRTLDPAHPEREPCLQLIRRCLTARPLFIAAVNAVVVVETMISLVYRSKVEASKASELLRQGFLKAEDRVITQSVTGETLNEALTLQARKPSIEFPDCVIAATMKQNEIRTIYTTNPKHFQVFDFIKEAIDPRRKTVKGH